MEQLRILKKASELEELKDYLKDKDFVAFDTETDGVLKSSRIIGYSICAEENIGYYVILRYWDVAEQRLIDLDTVEPSREIFEILKTKDLIMQNAPFDCGMVFHNYGIQLLDALHTDTLILAHLLNENRSNGLKELGVAFFGLTAVQEQTEMRESVSKNGGVLTRNLYELYKADAELIAKYGAKDAILTLKIFFVLIPQLYEERLDKFFYEDESMPLLRGPTYDMNTTGLKVDSIKLQTLRGELEAFCHEAKAFIYKEITPYVQHMYPGTSEKNTFNIAAPKQMAWLVYEILGAPIHKLTEGGRELCSKLDIKIPYTNPQRRDFKRLVSERYGQTYVLPVLNKKTGKMSRPKKVGNYWEYLACGKESLGMIEKKYAWVSKLLEYSRSKKLLETYVTSIQDKMQYNVIRPSFLQHGTTSGRYSSKMPNFQNLPRDDKRVKACIVSRPGKVFVGADYSQLEPRVFASFSGDERLLKCFSDGDDFYSVIGAETFDKFGYSLKKDDIGSFAKTFPELRQIAKVVGLASTYGTTAPKMAPTIGKTIEEAQEIIDNYFEKFPSVHRLMIESHQLAKKNGQVVNLFGRPRRMPQAKMIGALPHNKLPYELRNILNLAINHRIQSTGASIMNRAAIAFHKACKERRWTDVKIVMQVHDELIVEGPEALGSQIASVLKHAMENTVILPGVSLVADPKIAKNLADLK